MYLKEAIIQRPRSKNLIINIHKIFPKIPKIRIPTKATLTARLRLQKENRKSLQKLSPGTKLTLFTHSPKQNKIKIKNIKIKLIKY